MQQHGTKTQTRSFCHDLDYEIIKLKRNNLPDTSWHEIIVPIDSLADCRIRSRQLRNTRRITFKHPTSLGVFMANHTKIAINILTRVHSLTGVTLCAVMLSDEVFHVLASQPYLREVTILPGPTPSFSGPDRAAMIEEVLGEGVTRLSQAEEFTIPAEFVTPTVLSCLGQSQRLQYLEVTASTNAPYPGRVFLNCLDSLYPLTPGFFASLRLLRIEGGISNESYQAFSSKHMLNKEFSNIKFIKT